MGHTLSSLFAYYRHFPLQLSAQTAEAGYCRNYAKTKQKLHMLLYLSGDEVAQSANPADESEKLLPRLPTTATIDELRKIFTAAAAAATAKKMFLSLEILLPRSSWSVQMHGGAFYVRTSKRTMQFMLSFRS